MGRKEMVSEADADIPTDLRKMLTENIFFRDAETLLTPSRRLFVPRRGDPEERLQYARRVGLLRSVVRHEVAVALKFFEPTHLRTHLAALEFPERASPVTRSQRQRGDYAEEACRCLRGLWPNRSDDPIERGLSDALRVVHEALKLEATRSRDANLIERAKASPRGPLSDPSRIKRFIEQVAVPLRREDERFWKWDSLADLILFSGDSWVEPPCPKFVASFEDGDLSKELGRQASNQRRAARLEQRQRR